MLLPGPQCAAEPDAAVNASSPAVLKACYGLVQTGLDTSGTGGVPLHHVSVEVSAHEKPQHSQSSNTSHTFPKLSQ
jgi:hypothetical protein